MNRRAARPIAPAVIVSQIVLAVATGPAAAIVGSSSDATAQGSHVVMVLNRLGATAGFCSGIVVAQDVVMTAAHCVSKGAELRIHYPDAGAEPVMLPVASVARHPDFRADAIRTRERSIDLALLRLPAPLPARFSPIQVSKATGARLGARFTMLGYGVTREGDGASSGRLRSATLATRAPLSDVLLWAEDPAGAETGACTGDSGGPVVAEDSAAVSALIMWSAGRSGKRCGSLTQALWLAPHHPWIEKVMLAWTAASRR